MASVELKHNISDDQASNTNNNNNNINTDNSNNNDTNNEIDNQANDSDDRAGESYDNNDDNDTSTNNNDSNDSKKTNLIVNYLPQQMTDEQFEDLFKKFGNMKSCKIVRNRGTGYSYGFGFVDFETHEQALKAIEELNGHELETKKIKVAFARPAGQDIKQANLYIKNVPKDWSANDVEKVFEPYGNIIQVRVLGNDRGIAFVLYDLRKQAEDALEALNGKTLDGCESPLEIKFAADKKVEKGSATKNAPNVGAGGAGVAGPGRRERGRRGGRNRDRDRNGNRQSNQRSFFDRQNNNNNNNNTNNYNDRQNMRGGNQFNAVPYGGGAQYQDNFNNMNGIGPVRQAQNRMNRYAPFVPVQQPAMAPIPQTNPMVPQLAPNPAFGFPTQQQMIPFTMVPAQQMAPMQPVSQPGQLAPNPMAMYAAAQIPMGYAPVTQNAMSNIYSVASNNMNNAANMQPQIGQPMTMRNNNNNNGGGGSSSNMNMNLNLNNNNNNNTKSGGFDDGVTLFVYNIGPEADENELRMMFSPYGQVTKCNVVRKTPGGETKGFGFVTLRDRDQANSAIAGLNGSMRNGRALQVSLKK